MQLSDLSAAQRRLIRALLYRHGDGLWYEAPKGTRSTSLRILKDAGLLTYSADKFRYYARLTDAGYSLGGEIIEEWFENLPQRATP